MCYFETSTIDRTAVKGLILGDTNPVDVIIRADCSYSGGKKKSLPWTQFLRGLPTGSCREFYASTASSTSTSPRLMSLAREEESVERIGDGKDHGLSKAVFPGR